MLRQDFAPCICRDHEPATFDRPALFLPVILIMFVSFALLLALTNVPFGVQLGSIVPYTACIFLATFSAQRGQQPYFFECSIVHQTLPQLARRHFYFLIAILVLETVAFHLTTHMPSSWLARDRNGSPFGITLCVLCLCMATVQIFTNRSLLERAHLTKHALA